MVNQITLTKKLFKFYLNLILKMHDEQIRSRALKDLSYSLFLVFKEYEYD